jgi:lysocardiolipin and lysophospholipid acyltransferase
MNLSNLVRSILFISIPLLSALYASVFILFPITLLLLLLPVHSALSKLLIKAQNYLIGRFFLLWCSLLEFLGINIRIFCSPPEKHNYLLKPSGSSIVISNHPTDADWMFLWSLLYRVSHLSKLKIVLKASLKTPPLLGWHLSQSIHLFLTRNWAADQQKVVKFCDFFRGNDNPQHTAQSNANEFQLLLFPEGTDLTNGLQRSQKFAIDNNLRQYNEVLHPRATGFTYILQEMLQPTPSIANLYDISIAFPKFRLKKVKSLICGQFPEEICFYVQKISVDQLKNNNSEQNAELLTRLWAEKEQRLATFYARNEKNNLGLFYETNGEKSAELTLNETFVKGKMVVNLIVWLVLVALGLFCTANSLSFVVYMISSWLFYGAVTKFTAGLDQIFLDKFDTAKRMKA